MQLRDILARIQERLDELEISASAASKAAGKPDAIRNLQRAVERGDARQGISTATLNALAPVLKTTAVWLLAGAGPAEQSETEDLDPDRTFQRSKEGLVPARFGGVVEAGAFRPVEEVDPDPEREVIFVPRDPRFPLAQLFCFEVAGDSMNDLKPRPILPGDRLVCLNIEQVHLPLRDGMVVVVEQVLEGGHLRERSVKQVELYEDRTEFCPRSRNPRHKPIVVPRERQADDGRTVAAIAIVRSVMNDIPLG